MSPEPDVVVVPAGDALLGDPPSTVHVNVFAIAKHQVTNAEFAEFAAATAHAAPRWTKGASERVADGLSWADAVGYCRWLSIATARIYRLPDEREWEKAARAGVLEGLGAVREWTNTWADGARVLRGDARDLARRFTGSADLKGHGFRVVRSMTGR
ncbi:MAG TPA: SUMF1/EgtB/PvdO family nonheme iron enzyme [Candidatus Acidoferrales bacterium]|nr:SUMF1/EgtB/PvdO family nonheme iron enzyme [Candidatus Acidoferrales bacterium]